MPYSIATVAAPTAGGLPVAQAISIDCKGHTPKAVLVLVTRGTSLGTLTMGAMCSAGVTDGTTTRCGNSMSEDGLLAASADTGINYSNSKIIRVLASTTEAIDGEADFVSFAADTVNISWTDLPSAAYQIHVLAFWGARLTAKTFSLTCSTTDGGTASVTGLAAAPRALILVGARGNFLASGANADMKLGFAAFNADLSLQGQAAYGLRESDRASPTVCFSAIRDDCCGFRTTLTAEEHRYEATTATSDGFTITTRGTAGQPFALAGIAITVEGGRANCAVVDIGTNSTGNKTVSGLSGKPGLVMMLGTALGAKNTYTSTAPCGNWSLGAGIPPSGSSALKSACIGYAATDNATTSATQCVTDDATLGRVPADTSGTDWAAALVSVASGEFVVDVTTASPAARFLAYLAIEEPMSGAPPRRRIGAKGERVSPGLHGHALGGTTRHAAAPPSAGVPTHHAAGVTPRQGAALGGRPQPANNKTPAWMRDFSRWRLDRLARLYWEQPHPKPEAEPREEGFQRGVVRGPGMRRGSISGGTP